MYKLLITNALMLLLVVSVTAVFAQEAQSPASESVAVQPETPAADAQQPAEAAESTTAPSEASDKASALSVGDTDQRLQIRLTLYTWFSRLSNDVKTESTEISSDVPFSDVFDVLDFANFAHVEAQKGKWGAFSELDFVKLSEDTQFRNRRGIPVKINADMVLKQTILELGAFRSFQAKRVGFDALLGARYFRFDSDVHLGPLDSSLVTDWVDPMVGARLRFALSERWSAWVRADLAGFGVGSGSELTTNAVAVVSYKISDRYDVGFGYRYMDVQYEKDETEIDMQTYGPVIGMAIRF